MTNLFWKWAPSLAIVAGALLAAFIALITTVTGSPAYSNDGIRVCRRNDQSQPIATPRVNTNTQTDIGGLGLRNCLTNPRREDMQESEQQKAFRELLADIRKRINVIDAATPFTSNEPQWWLAMMSVSDAAYRAQAIVDFAQTAT